MPVLILAASSNAMLDCQRTDMSDQALTEDRGKFQVSLLSQSDLGLWDELVDRSPHGTVFHSSWWLQETGFDFQVLAVSARDGKLVAGIPLPRKRGKGLMLFYSPPLTPFLGPVFDIARLSKAYEKYTLMRRAGEVLARAIAGFETLDYWVGPAAPDLQGFLWAGFDVHVGYTMRFESGSRPEDIQASMTKGHQNTLQRAIRDGVECEVANEVDALLEFHEAIFKRQHLSPYSMDLPKRLIEASLDRGHGRMYVARLRGEIVSVLWVVHDSRSSYLLITASRPPPRHTAAVNLIEWHAIQDALFAGRAFDFEGSHLRGVEQHYRHWGAEARPIWHLTKMTRIGALARFLNSWIPRRR